MANKKKTNVPPTKQEHTCYMCGKEISGDHVYIKTRRQTKLHIHKECVPIGKG